MYYPDVVSMFTIMFSTLRGYATVYSYYSDHRRLAPFHRLAKKTFGGWLCRPRPTYAYHIKVLFNG